MILKELQASWVDTPEYHKQIADTFTDLVNGNEALKEHRDYIQDNVYGFGERPFWWLWKVLLDEVPDNAKLLEIGVFKGATLSVWRLLKPLAYIAGVTPLDSTGIERDGDYKTFITDLFIHFKQVQPIIIEGLSEDPICISVALDIAPYNVVYVDGGHLRQHIDNDLKHYAPMVVKGGYLVIDDSCNDMNQPFGYFQGIQDVTDGVIDYMKEHGDNWEFIGNVVHLRIYKRK